MLNTWLAALRARLIVDAHRAWRFTSVQIAGAGAVLIELWNQLPGSVRDHLPAPIADNVPVLIFVAVIAGRLFKQEKHDG